MERRQQIERIIIGTLLNACGNDDTFSSVKDCITPAMFSDERLGKIFALISSLKQKGFERTTPYELFVEKKDEILDILPFILELSIDYDFYVMKYEYNRNVYYTDKNERKRFTYVNFDDYVTRFINLVYEDEPKR